MSSRRPSVTSLVALAVLAAVLTACGGGGGATAASLAALNGDWSLTSGTGPDGEVEVGDGVEVTLTIDGDAWGGTVCNSYHAQQVEIGDGTVTIGDVPRTEMACLDDRLMRAEEAYLAAFVGVRAYEVTDDELRLSGDGVELVYVPVEAPPTPELVGTVWVLDTITEGTGPDGTARSTFGEPEPTLVLGADGSLVVHSGCQGRDDGSTYEVVDDRLRVTFAFEYADYTCETEELQAQDTAVWEVLAGEPTIAIDGQRLTLTAGEVGLGFHAEVAAD